MKRSCFLFSIHIPKSKSYDGNHFPWKVEIRVQWGDQDSFNHVNNVIYLRYFETARIQYLAGTNWINYENGVLKSGPIIKSITCDYIKPVIYPSTLTLYSAISEKKEKGLTMGTVFKLNDDIVAVAKAVIISFDYEAKKPAAIPKDVNNYMDEVDKDVPTWVKERLFTKKT